MGSFSKASLTKKFLIFLLFIGLLPLFSYGIISIVSTNLVLRDETLNFHEQLSDQRKKYIDLVMDDIGNMITSLSGMDELKDALNESTSDSTYKRLTTQAKIGYILSGYSNLNGLISIEVFTAQDVHFHVGETLNVSNINTELKEQLFKEASLSKDLIYWSGIEKSINNNSQYESSIIAAKIIKSTNQNTAGLLVVSYNPNAFSDIFLKYENQKAYSLIIDDKNRIIYHPDRVYIGKTINEAISQKFKEKKGSFEQIIEGKNTLVVYEKTQKGEWTIASYVPMSSIYEKSTSTNIIFTILIFICILSILYLGIIFSKQIVSPIIKVTETFRMLQNGDIDKPKKIIFKNKDEIGELATLFNSFIDAREDITLQKKLEKELNEQKKELEDALAKLKDTQIHLIQQEKLAGIGQLAAGVAHEINNPLGFVSSNFDIISKYINRYEKVLLEVEEIKNLQSIDKEVCLQRVDKVWKETKIEQIKKDMTSILEDTQEGIERITKIVNGLKSFSRINKIEQMNMLNLNEEIKTTLLVAHNELKYNIDVNFIKGEIPEIYANGGQINQVILNIILNAVHAINENKKEERGLINIETYKDDMNVVCSIEDNGCGMSEVTLQRLFEPFYTTKPVGQGTGLGLSIAYDIIKKHNGTISVTSKVGIGTKFIISLPLNSNQQPEDE